MSTHNHIFEEGMENEGSLPRSNGNPYSVPEGYFEGFAGSLLSRIRSQESSSEMMAELQGLSPLLASIPRTMPFELPAGYFEATVADLPALISEEDSLVLSFIDKEMPYEVPRGYFSGFAEQMLERVAEKQSARVVPLFRRKWARMSVAAALIAILGLSGVVYYNNDKPAGGDPVAVEIKKASNAELNAFINNAAAMTADDAATAKNSKDVNGMLKDVSDNELEAFLADVPADEDDAFDIN